ncbi:MAG: FAD/NAD(P)-binding protein [Candidatus Acidiferrales bacterium]
MVKSDGGDVADEKSDRELGMGRRIARRDFLNGVSIAVRAAAFLPNLRWLETLGIPQSPFAPEKSPDYYPPTLTGMRGTTDVAMQAGHALRDGKIWPNATPDPGRYDLIVVGGGISGLSAAYFYRKIAGPGARILILENLDDFGGHAKRNEYHPPERMLIGYGGTQSIDSPDRWSKHARGLIQELGVDVQRFEKYFDRALDSDPSESNSVFFDKETFGDDVLVAGRGRLPWEEFFGKAPLSAQAKQDLTRLHTEKVDYLPHLSTGQKKVLLAKTSYKDYLLKYVNLHSDALPYLQKQTYGLYGVGIDAVPAADVAGLGYPGFGGMDLSGPPGPGLGAEVTQRDDNAPYIYHFPDGNASIARLLIRALISGSAAGTTMEDIVTAKMNYAVLDDPKSRVRVRLNSTVVKTANVGDAENAKEVEVTYVRGEQAHVVRANTCILACWNMVIPYICPDMSRRQKDALAYGVKVPVVYTNVQIRNSRAFEKLGVRRIKCPGSFFTTVEKDYPVSMGDYKYPASPDDPCVLHLERFPCGAGATARDQQIAGRMELYHTQFATFERNIRSQLGRALSPGGFDPARDIQAITVNRWPHGYAYEYNSLFDPNWPENERPCVIGRQPFGRISIANSDAGAFAYTSAAIDQAYRAVKEVARFSHKPASKVAG